jgi:hypothetical protein
MGSEFEGVEVEPDHLQIQTRYNLIFWAVYSACTLGGLFILDPMLHTLLRGRPGDQVAFWLSISSVVLVTIILAISYAVWLRRVRFVLRLVIAMFAGLSAFLPYYLLWGIPL